MREEGVDSFDRFHEWLEEEKKFLIGLKRSPKTNEESLEMEYVQKLINLSVSKCVIVLCSLSPTDFLLSGRSTVFLWRRRGVRRPTTLSGRQAWGRRSC